LRCATFLLAAYVAIVLRSAPAWSQTTYAQELWPELRLHHSLDDLSQVVGILEFNRDQDSGQVEQVTAGVDLDRRFTDWFVGGIGYRHGTATGGGAYYENRLLTEQTFHIPFPQSVSADARTREEFRWLDTGFSMRFRERVQVQRDTTIGDYTFQPYGSVELFYDTRYGEFSRYRLIAGVTFPILSYLSAEPYLAHQVDYASGYTIVDAIGFKVHVSY